MKVTIPDNLKQDVPQTTFGKILSATPVVMAVVATMLAGLASSEMTRAQYDRSLAAQQQSKAGDQWSFFQAKRLRGAYQQNTADLLQTITEVHPLDAAALKTVAEQIPETAKPDANGAAAPETAKVKSQLQALLASPSGQQALSMLQKGELPANAASQLPPLNIKASLDAIENLKSDAEVAETLKNIQDKEIQAAMHAARDQVQDFDTATGPVNHAIDQFQKLLTQPGVFPAKPASAQPGGGIGGDSINRDFTAARLKYAALRYEVEARLNQSIANLYELQVRKSNLSAERHHRRSQKFFFGMLGAQLAVIISTFAIAARQRNLLWTLAAVAGLLAIAFAVFVYVTM